MNDMSESKHRQFLEEGRRALAEKKAKTRAARFTAGREASKVRRNIYDNTPVANPYAAKRAAAAPVARKRIKGTAVAAFMWLPQFRLSLNGFSHIYPVFIRMLAVLLVQAGLIPDTHPSLAYGAVDVPRVGFRKLMGEAWFNLRIRKSTYSQYGIFGIVMMTIAVLFASVGTLLARVFLGVGEVAQAQLFFTHPGDPYGAGAGKTDLSAVNTISANSTFFDSRVSGGNISTDYALMVLDKILRQAGADTPNGGAVQNALAGMMKGYNAGVSIVAAVMIFWMIISIVLDTAKTGVFGGGRHNMVWAPIRVIFALGLMFPLGSGFSSGQYLVMKFAEWGSNFGSRGWTTYVTAVVTDQSLLMPFSATNATSLVAGISKVMTCQVAYNTYVAQSTGSLDADQAIMAVQEVNPNVPFVTNRYTNKTASNVCGVIKYGTDATTDDYDRGLAWSAATQNMPMTSSTYIVSTVNYMYKNDALSTAMIDFRKAMRAALKTDLNDTPAGNKGSGGTVLEMARSFACKFVSRKFPDGGGSNPVAAIPQCAGQGPAGATDPDAKDHQDMVDKIMTDIQAAYSGPGRTALTNYITSPTGMVGEMKKRGWAGMGMWYQDITSINGVISGAREMPASYEPGTIWSTAGRTGWFRCAANKILGRACRISGLEEKVLAVMGEYDRWWETASVAGSAGHPTHESTDANKDLNEDSSNAGINSLISWIMDSKGDMGLADRLARIVLPNKTGTFIFDPIDLQATNTYPLAQLANVGHTILTVGLFIWSAVTLIQGISSISGFTFSAGLGLAFGALINGLATIGTALITSGIMIAFYLPVLPFVRVAFAVLTWMTSVFEAIVMVPIAALCHLTSTGEGLAGQARTCWILWLNILMRPILVVMGYVAGMLLYNTFALYFNQVFGQGAASMIAAQSSEYYALLSKVTYSIIYLSVLYTAANTSFKLLDVFPSALMRWMGGQPDHSMDKHGDGGLLAANQTIRTLQPSFRPKTANNDPNDPNSVASRADNIKGQDTKKMTDAERKQADYDTRLAYDRMNAKERVAYNNLSGQERNDFVAAKFKEQEDSRYIRLGLNVKGASGGGGEDFGNGANFGMGATFSSLNPFKK